MVVGLAAVSDFLPLSDPAFSDGLDWKTAMASGFLALAHLALLEGCAARCVLSDARNGSALQEEIDEQARDPREEKRTSSLHSCLLPASGDENSL